MDIFDLLEQEHRGIIALIEKLEKTAQPEQRVVLVRELELLVVPHARAEQGSMYPFLKRRDKMLGEVVEAEAEHELAEHLLHDLSTCDPASEIWNDKFHALKDHLVQHFKLEETSLFVAARKILDTNETTMLSEQLPRAKEGFLKGMR
ncbi:MAG: hemerythrin domain-containing protein [Patescibacteria group bacterium]